VIKTSSDYGTQTTGSLFIRHPRCLPKQQVLKLYDGVKDGEISDKNIKGFSKLSEEDKDSLKTALEEIRDGVSDDEDKKKKKKEKTATTKTKKAASTTKKGTKRKKAERGEAPAKRKKKPKDPNAPKKPQTAFFLYMHQERLVVKKNNPEMKAKDISKTIGAQWRELTEQQKKPYHDEYEKLKAEYTKILAKYKKEKKENGEDEEEETAQEEGDDEKPKKRKKRAPKKKVEEEEEEEAGEAEEATGKKTNGKKEEEEESEVAEAEGE